MGIGTQNSAEMYRQGFHSSKLVCFVLHCDGDAAKSGIRGRKNKVFVSPESCDKAESGLTKTEKVKMY